AGHAAGSLQRIEWRLELQPQRLIEVHGDVGRTWMEPEEAKDGVRTEKIQQEGGPEEQEGQTREVCGEDGIRPERAAQSIWMLHTPGDHLPHVHAYHHGKDDEVGV